MASQLDTERSFKRYHHYCFLYSLECVKRKEREKKGRTIVVQHKATTGASTCWSPRFRRDRLSDVCLTSIELFHL